MIFSRNWEIEEVKGSLWHRPHFRAFSTHKTGEKTYLCRTFGDSHDELEALKSVLHAIGKHEKLTAMAEIHDTVLLTADALLNKFPSAPESKNLRSSLEKAKTLK